ncbi:MAG: hypothetical protein ACRC7O_13260 [Fimbriiglobus sp.]
MSWNAGVGLAVLAATRAGLTLYHPVTAAGRPGPRGVDRVTAYDRKVDAVRSELPARGRVGYRVVRDRDPAEWAIYGRRFTQYAAVPVLVDPDESRPDRIDDLPNGMRVVRGGSAR